MRQLHLWTTKLTRKFKIPSQQNSETAQYFALHVRYRLVLSNAAFQAHPPFADRLRTIIGYDRICVMDAGTIAEFDTPTNLFNKTSGIFRGMCDRSSITLDDISWAAKERQLDLDIVQTTEKD